MFDRKRRNAVVDGVVKEVSILLCDKEGGFAELLALQVKVSLFADGGGSEVPDM